MSEQSSEMDLPRVLITSATIEKSKELAKSIGGKFLSEGTGIEYYMLDIDNKYYSTQILLCAMEHSLISSGFEAIVLHHDLQTEDAVQSLDQWISPLTAEAEVHLLVCDSIPDTLVRTKATEWCLRRKFEIVELNQTDFTDIEDIDMGKSKFGIERITEALEAHTWSNMILKGSRAINPQTRDVNLVGEQLENVQLNSTQNPLERLQMEHVLDGIMDIENADFGELFSQLKEMKGYAASLPRDQHKAAAEQLVIAFWKAMGGDPSEVEDID